MVNTLGKGHSAKPVPRIPRFGHFAECFYHSTRQRVSLPSATHDKVTELPVLIIYYIPTTSHKYMTYITTICHKYITIHTYHNHKFTYITNISQVHNHKSQVKIYHNHKF
jgi:hypothetical protein